jgi:hypothetical protein
METPNRPKQHWRCDRGEHAIKAKLTEPGHVSDPEGVCERRQTDEYKERNPNPRLLDGGEKQKKDHAVENGSDVSVGDTEGSGEWCISDSLTSLAEDGAPEVLYSATLI